MMIADPAFNLLFQEGNPLASYEPGDYRLRTRQGVDVLAEGTFKVVAAR